MKSFTTKEISSAKTEMMGVDFRLEEMLRSNVGQMVGEELRGSLAKKVAAIASDCVDEHYFLEIEGDDFPACEVSYDDISFIVVFHSDEEGSTSQVFELVDI